MVDSEGCPFKHGNENECNLLSRVDERVGFIFEYVKKQNGRIGKLETKFWILTVVCVLIAALALGNDAIGLLKVLL